MNLSYKSGKDIIPLLLSSLEYQGFAVVTDAISPQRLSEAMECLGEVDAALKQDSGEEFLSSERPSPFYYHRHFLHYLEHPLTTHVVEAVIGDWATLRFQNLECHRGLENPEHQSQWHMNLKLASEDIKAVDILYFLTEMTEETGLLDLVPGTHRAQTRPPIEYLTKAKITFECPAGSALIMNPKLWHREREPNEKTNQVHIQQLFVPPYLKAYWDYPRMVEGSTTEHYSPRIRRYLGFDSRVPSSIKDRSQNNNTQA